MRPPASTDGTQSIRRAASVLRAIAQAGANGDRLAGIAQRLGLPRSTVHRILACLIEEGLVSRADDHLYRMGPLVHELGLTPAPSGQDVLRWRPVVDRVAQLTGVTSYLMRRSGIEAVCLAKADGHAVVRFVPVDVGQRRLLGVGAGATALLAALEPAQVEDTIRAVAPGLARYPRLSADALRAAVLLAQRTGYAISQGTVVNDGFGMGCALPATQGAAHLAISIAAHASTVTESRVAAWKKVVTEEILRASVER
ncbi:MAG: helix-turn-helix domain-containing protein [Hydrogenophaga sp.]|nr:helix-turn-helix domain-containing protein [Hydrogenophaga sp.]MBX3608706.1 helix-turn-helix domain-containing protein [Hydrogenophaga sp.]